MQNADPENISGMLAVIGLDINNLNKILNNLDNNLKFEIANDNAPGQVVISLEKKNFEPISDKLKSFGAKKVIPLNVSSAFHSSFMKNAEIKMLKELDSIKIIDSKYPIVSNYSALPAQKRIDILNNLKNQILNKVRWVETIKYMENNNIKTIIEIGPSKVLNGLNKRISSKLSLINVSNINELENLKNVL